MKISVEKVENGYVISYPDYVDGGNGVDQEVSRSVVIEEGEDEYGEQKAFVSLCWKMHELFGILRNKHAERQLRIELTDGDEEKV